MNKSIEQLLEISVAFILFVFGLSTFLTMQSGLMDHQREGRLAVTIQQDVGVTDQPVPATYVSKEGLYFVLTEDSHLGKGNWLGESGYTSDAGGIKVTVNGVVYPVVTDYRGKRSLKIALQALPYTVFDEAYVVDDQGRLSEIRYTGR